MTGALERIAAARQACAAALESIAQRVPFADGLAGTTWDAEAAISGLERVDQAFEALGDPASLEAEAPAGAEEEVRAALGDLARVHILLTMAAAREKDALRERLMLVAQADRVLEWHASESAGERFDMNA